MGRPTKRTPKRETRFLESLGKGLSVSAAAAAADMSATTAYDWRRAYPAFAARWDEAFEAGTDLLEDEALRRAVQGFDKPVYYRGTKVGDVRQFSDALLMFLLRTRRPDKYRPPAAADPSAIGDNLIGIDNAGLSELEFTQRLAVLTLRLAEVDSGTQADNADRALGAPGGSEPPADADAAGAGAGKPSG